MPEVTQEIQTADPRRRPQPEEGPLTIIYEDDSTLVVNKPAGLVVHPTYKNTSGTLLNAVLWRVRDRDGAQPGILTRLDKDTSGLVVIALTPAVHAIMQKDAAARRTRKQYLAIVCGLPQPRQGQIVLPLARDPADRRRVVVTPDGAPCETHYEVLSSEGRMPSFNASSSPDARIRFACTCRRADGPSLATASTANRTRESRDRLCMPGASRCCTRSRACHSSSKRRSPTTCEHWWIHKVGGSP